MQEQSCPTDLGCWTIAKILAALTLLLPLALCGWVNSRQIDGPLPPQVRYSRILGYGSQNGLREGCIYVAYALSPESADALRRSGLDGLKNARPYHENAGNTFEPWRKTPSDGVKNNGLYAMGAGGGCNEPIDRSIPHAETLLNEPRNFYTVTRNREGLLVVSPDRYLALYLYFG